MQTPHSAFSEVTPLWRPNTLLSPDKSRNLALHSALVGMGQNEARVYCVVLGWGGTVIIERFSVLVGCSFPSLSS